ncbi:MAG: pantetheine-phosphate adenylyltransferase, partial [Oscillospiraceae bacterium]
IVLVVTNLEKKPCFSIEERVALIRKTTQGIQNVEVDGFCGLLVDYVREKNASAIVKGLRAMSDFEYEFQMALANKILLPYTETVFLTTNNENMYLSSSMVKQVGQFGGDISEFVPRCIVDDVAKKIIDRRRKPNDN